jgi:hypothetical protein
LKELQKAFEVSIGRKDEVFFFFNLFFNWDAVNAFLENKFQELIIV